MRNENRKHLVWTILIALLVIFILFFYSQTGLHNVMTGLGIYNPVGVENNSELLGDENNNQDQEEPSEIDEEGIVVLGSESSPSSRGGGGGRGETRLLIRDRFEACTAHSLIYELPERPTWIQQTRSKW